MMLFGIELSRLQQIGQRHHEALAAAEAAAFGSLAYDHDVSPEEFHAFIKFRAAAALRSAFLHDSAGFEAALLELPALQAELGL
jgi:hypothetical protein